MEKKEENVDGQYLTPAKATKKRGIPRASRIKHAASTGHL